MTVLIVFFSIAVFFILFLNTERFGRRPSGKRMKKILQSPNYRDGQFQNLENTPALAEGVSYYTVFKKFFFSQSKRSKPKQPLPVVKTDLKNLRHDENVIIWFGHSSYFLQVDGIKFLVDPVFSGHASPVSFTTKAFAYSKNYTAEDMPEIDCMIITHDHWDHLDYDTVLQLKGKTKQIVTGLGTGEHFERWGFDMDIVSELDWDTSMHPLEGFTLTAVPARHFSGRGLKRNAALWAAFVLQTPNFKMFIGGDSGYGVHFKAIGDALGPFDIAILECGQYNEYWHYIHMLPEEIIKAAKDLKAEKVMPVHWGKFSLALHDWDEPIHHIFTEADKEKMPLFTPMIGEKAALDNPDFVFKRWWEGLA
jgi:L-ascorbate metabolism protein UlaG (beta-lactamase superfamily)